MEKSLDRKLARIHADPACGDFILADAKDADMAYGLASAGKGPEQHAGEARFRSLDEYRHLMRQVLHQGLVDILLMSCSSNEILTIQEKLFASSPVTPAVRANDTTDIWLASGTGRYGQQPSLPFRSAAIDQIMCGKGQCAEGERSLGADLGLYSATFNNDTELDCQTLEAYKAFRLEAEAKGLRHFLEVFDPNACGDHCPKDIGRFLGDHITRALAGVPSTGRPIFLKIPYHGPAAMEALAGYDRSLVVGILGGAAGTTMDAFGILAEAKKYGARAALYGRKINNAEDQLAFVQCLRRVADGQIDAAQGVRSYHAQLAAKGLRPRRSLEDDLVRTQSGTSSYGNAAAPVQAPGRRAVAVAIDGSKPDFSKMSSQEKVAWNRARLDRSIGSMRPASVTKKSK